MQCHMIFFSRHRRIFFSFPFSSLQPRVVSQIVARGCLDSFSFPGGVNETRVGFVIVDNDVVEEVDVEGFYMYLEGFCHVKQHHVISFSCHRLIFFSSLFFITSTSCGFLDCCLGLPGWFLFSLNVFWETVNGMNVGFMIVHGDIVEEIGIEGFYMYLEGFCHMERGKLVMRKRMQIKTYSSTTSCVWHVTFHTEDSCITVRWMICSE